MTQEIMQFIRLQINYDELHMVVKVHNDKLDAPFQ
jgi:hypothetical protein